MNELRNKIVEHRAKVFNLAQEYAEHGESATTEELIALDNSIIDALIDLLPLTSPDEALQMLMDAKESK